MSWALSFRLLLSLPPRIQGSRCIPRHLLVLRALLCLVHDVQTLNHAHQAVS